MDDLEFILGLMRLNTNELGFIPKQGVQGHLKRGEYLIKPSKGYIIHGAVNLYKPVRIHQTCIEYDFRENGFGRELVEKLIQRAAANYASSIILRCAEDIQANQFWKALGFQVVDIEPPRNTRNRRIIKYARLVKPSDLKR